MSRGGGYGTKWRRNIGESFNPVSTAHEHYRRQTDDREISDSKDPNVTYSRFLCATSSEIVQFYQSVQCRSVLILNNSFLEWTASDATPRTLLAATPMIVTTINVF